MISFFTLRTALSLRAAIRIFVIVCGHTYICHCEWYCRYIYLSLEMTLAIRIFVILRAAAHACNIIENGAAHTYISDRDMAHAYICLGVWLRSIIVYLFLSIV